MTQRSAPKPRRGRKAQRGGGAGARGFTTGALAEDYLRLCRDPLRDLQRWMDEDKKRGRAGREVQLTTKKEEYAQTTTAANSVAQTGGLRGQPLHAMQGRLDTDRAGGWNSDGVLARSRAGAGRYDGLQSVRTDQRAAVGLGQVAGDVSAEAYAKAEVTAEAAPNFSSELAAVAGYYAARLAATRAGLSPRDIAAAVRAIQNEKIVAIRAVLERWSAASRGATEKRQATRAAAPVRPISGHQPS